MCVDQIASVHSIRTEHTRKRTRRWETERDGENAIIFFSIDRFEIAIYDVKHKPFRWPIDFNQTEFSRLTPRFPHALFFCGHSRVCISKLDNLDWTSTKMCQPPAAVAASTAVCIYLLLASFCLRLLLSIWKSGICDAMWYVFIYKNYVAAIVWFDASCCECVCRWYEIARTTWMNECVCMCDRYLPMYVWV